VGENPPRTAERQTRSSPDGTRCGVGSPPSFDRCSCPIVACRHMTAMATDCAYCGALVSEDGYERHLRRAHADELTSIDARRVGRPMAGEGVGGCSTPASGGPRRVRAGLRVSVSRRQRPAEYRGRPARLTNTGSSASSTTARPSTSPIRVTSRMTSASTSTRGPTTVTGASPTTPSAGRPSRWSGTSTARTSP